MVKRLIIFACVAIVGIVLSSCASLSVANKDKDSVLLKRIKLLEARVEFNAQLIEINSQRIDSIAAKIEEIKERLAKERKNSDMFASIPPASEIERLDRVDGSSSTEIGGVGVKKVSAQDSTAVSTQKNSSAVLVNASLVPPPLNKTSKGEMSINYNSYKSLYKKALDLYWSREYKKSSKLFERFISKFKDTDLYDNSLYWLAWCYIHMDKEKKAISLLEKIVKEFPYAPLTKGGKTDCALFDLYKIFKKKGDFKKADYYKKLLLKRFPNSVYTQKIKS